MKHMSNLAVAFFQRQTSRRDSIISSSSTVSSNEAEERVQNRQVSFKDFNNPPQEDLSSNGFYGNQISMNLSSCNDVTVGDRVTNVYQNYYAKVMCHIVIHLKCNIIIIITTCR